MRNAFASLLLAACAAPATAPLPDPAQLLGSWQVDLRPTPDAGPYFQAFVVERLEGLTNAMTRAFLAYWSATKE